VGKGFDLALKKSGPTECSPGGTCSYSLTVTNASQAPFSVVIKFADTLPSGWKLISSGTAKCRRQGDLVARERPKLTLQPNWTETIRLEAQLPANEKRNEVENCASLDYGKGQGDANPANDKSCVTTKLKVERVPPSSPAEECTKKGWVWDGQQCLSPEEVWQNKGWVWDGKRCVQPTSPADECKKRGWVWDGKQCLSPEEICKNKGWVWERRKQRCLPPLSPAEECKKRGWIWDGEQCLTPADACQKRG
jgi:uncharacterized repeat protein (TIGR01451 family)